MENYEIRDLILLITGLLILFFLILIFSEIWKYYIEKGKEVLSPILKVIKIYFQKKSIFQVMGDLFGAGFLYFLTRIVSIARLVDSARNVFLKFIIIVILSVLLIISVIGYYLLSIVFLLFFSLIKIIDTPFLLRRKYKKRKERFAFFIINTC